MVSRVVGLFGLCLLTPSAGLRTRKHSTGSIDLSLHYPDASQTSCEVILFSVGTATSVGGYDSMAGALTQKGFVVAIVDPQKGNPTKLDVEKLREAYSHVKDNLVGWAGDKCQSVSKWIVGGHSAGGGTAHKVFDSDPSMADAVFSVDPFTKGDMGGEVNLPSLFWGFDVTTCFVTKEVAAVGYYALTSSEKRVLVRAQKELTWSACGYAPKYFHCSVVDGGCTACTNCMDTPEYFFEDVANSVRVFVDNLEGTFAPSFDFTTPTDIFVDTDVA